VTQPAELARDPWVQAHGLVVTRDHGPLGAVTTNGPGARLSRTPLVPGRPASRPGEDAESILAESGLRAELDSLESDGVVAAGLRGSQI
jgi:crotonobetainyl-CoA:carnitine CoA-transferase CaiB-like acyl-CoA transferase